MLVDGNTIVGWDGVESDKPRIVYEHAVAYSRAIVDTVNYKTYRVAQFKELFLDKAQKNPNVISWDEYFMGLAILSAKRSKDPSTQVGACIVKNNRVLSVGYNGMPFGCSDDEFPWDREGETTLETKYPFVVHAELNAILNNRTGSLEGAKIYVALFPCNECAKAIIQSGIKEIIYISDKYSDTDAVKASKRMLDTAGVKYTVYKGIEKITLQLS